MLRRLELRELKALDARPEPLRYEHQRPSDVIHFDTKKLVMTNGIGHRISDDRSSRQRGIGWDYLHGAMDDCSSLAYTELLAADTGEACAGFLGRAAAWFATRTPQCPSPQPLHPSALPFKYSKPVQKPSTALKRPNLPADGGDDGAGRADRRTRVFRSM